MNKKINLTDIRVVMFLAGVCCFLWGSATPAIKTGYRLFQIDSTDTSSILLFAGTRFFLAGILVIAWHSLTSRKWIRPPRGSALAIVELALSQTILQYARQDIRFLLSQNVKFLMAACGTVSSTYPSEEASRLPVPYTGVVGAAARKAATLTRNHRVGVIGTAATIRSGSYAALLKDLVPDIQITAKACPLFVPLVESGHVADGDPVTTLVIEQYLTEVRDAGVDTLILGCTHYPLLKKMIGDFMGEDVALIDPGKVTAIETAAALDDLGLTNGRSEGGRVHYYVSDTPEAFKELENLFLGEYAGGPVDQIAIETY